MKIRIHDYIQESYVDGPGIRFTLFVQGCPHHCEGCHNPQTHAFDGGKEIDTQEIVDKMLKNPLIDGLTLSGGEPFSQVNACLVLIKQLKQANSSYDVVVYTGYTFEQLLEWGQKAPHVIELLSNIDYLIDGPFILSQRDLELDFRGSRNQRILNARQSLKEHKAVETVFEM